MPQHTLLYLYYLDEIYLSKYKPAYIKKQAEKYLPDFQLAYARYLLDSNKGGYQEQYLNILSGNSDYRHIAAFKALYAFLNQGNISNLTEPHISALAKEYKFSVQAIPKTSPVYLIAQILLTALDNPTNWQSIKNEIKCAIDASTNDANKQNADQITFEAIRNNLSSLITNRILPSSHKDDPTPKILLEKLGQLKYCADTAHTLYSITRQLYDISGISFSDEDQRQFIDTYEKLLQISPISPRLELQLQYHLFYLYRKQFSSTGNQADLQKTLAYGKAYLNNSNYPRGFKRIKKYTELKQAYQELTPPNVFKIFKKCSPYVLGVPLMFLFGIVGFAIDVVLAGLPKLIHYFIRGGRLYSPTFKDRVINSGFTYILGKLGRKIGEVISGSIGIIIGAVSNLLVRGIWELSHPAATLKLRVLASPIQYISILNSNRTGPDQSNPMKKPRTYGEHLIRKTTDTEVSNLQYKPLLATEYFEKHKKAICEDKEICENLRARLPSTATSLSNILDVAIRPVQS